MNHGRQGTKMDFKIGDIVTGTNSSYWSHGGLFRIVNIEKGRAFLSNPLRQYKYYSEYHHEASFPFDSLAFVHLTWKERYSTEELI